MEYNYYSQLFKALSEANRLKILDLIASEDTCACDILKDFNITQPTFAHHISVLNKYELIKSNKVWNKSYNTLNLEKLNEIKDFIDKLITKKQECLCDNRCNCKLEDEEVTKMDTCDCNNLCTCGDNCNCGTDCNCGTECSCKK